MVKELMEHIKNQVEVRKNLIQLKEELKDFSNVYACKYELAEDAQLFLRLLCSEDAKIRKNTALVMGRLGEDSYLEPLYKAYEQETQLFVKSSYLTAIGELNYMPLLEQLKARLAILKMMETDAGSEKHIAEERRVLTQLILSVEGIEKHAFTGWNQQNNLILITNRNCADITKRQIEELASDSGYKDTTVQTFTAGVMVKTKHLKEIQQLRTYRELLFALEDVKTCTSDSATAAKEIAAGSLLDFLDTRHQDSKGGTPQQYYFRVEYKGKVDLAQKSTFTKKFAAQLEKCSGGRLMNSTSNYEVELRLIENKAGRLNFLVKLYTLKDTRFAYRVNTVAASIQPFAAALMMELAQPYLRAEAKILDPFCGVGTMLIERHKFLRANTLYGIDIYGDAIEKARVNTEKAGVIAHYVNKDFFEFEHEYAFHEIVTNMPRVTGHKLENEIADIYKRFFVKAGEHLMSDGVIVLHSYEPELVRKYVKPNYHIVKEFELSKKERSYLFIIRA